MITHQVKLNEVIIDVTGTYYKGGFVSWDEMPEPSCFEIEKLEICDVDVSELLDDRINEIENLVIEKFYS